jgi:hypothetical protein
MDISTFLGARTNPDRKSLIDILTFLVARTVPDKEKPDGHFNISRSRGSFWQRKAWWTFWHFSEQGQFLTKK